MGRRVHLFQGIRGDPPWISAYRIPPDLGTGALIHSLERVIGLNLLYKKRTIIEMSTLPILI